MKQTTNYKMNLPEYTDSVDIEQLNDNFKTIDEKLFETATKTNVNGILKGDGEGNVVAATADSDYMSPSTYDPTGKKQDVFSYIDSKIQAAIQNTWEASY